MGRPSRAAASRAKNIKDSPRRGRPPGARYVTLPPKDIFTEPPVREEPRVFASSAPVLTTTMRAARNGSSTSPASCPTEIPCCLCRREFRGASVGRFPNRKARESVPCRHRFYNSTTGQQDGPQQRCRWNWQEVGIHTSTRSPPCQACPFRMLTVAETRLWSPTQCQHSHHQELACIAHHCSARRHLVFRHCVEDASTVDRWFCGLCSTDVAQHGVQNSASAGATIVDSGTQTEPPRVGSCCCCQGSITVAAKLSNRACVC